MSEQHVTRRAILGGAVAIAAGLAGCSGDTAGGAGSTDDPTGSDTLSVEGYLSNTGNYDGVVDETDAAEVTVAVGSEANGGNFGFAPPAVRVATGTTVVWRWTGLGSSHNVVAEDGSFGSELVAEEGHTFSQRFDEQGTVGYYCTPHRPAGMNGVVVVE